MKGTPVKHLKINEMEQNIQFEMTTQFGSPGFILT